MVSFDVESLFTNVPIDAAVQAALQKLENDPSLADRTKLTPAQIADLLTFVLRSIYFLYNGSIYEQKDAVKATAVLPYVKGLSEQLRRCLQQQGVRAVSKSETRLRSQLVRPLVFCKFIFEANV